MILKAVGKKLHIFVEKPLCVSVAEAKEIQRAIHESGVCFYMSDPFVRSGTLGLKRLIDEGRLGKITGAAFHYGTDAALTGRVNYRRDQTLGGIMADVGGHMIHKAHYLFGKPQRVSAVLEYQTAQAKKNKIEEAALVTMQYPDGKLVSLECSWLCGTRSSLELVCGTKGCAAVSLDGERLEDEVLTFRTGNDAPVTLGRDALPAAPTRHVRYWVEMMAKGIPNEMVGVDPFSCSGVSIDDAVEYVEIIEAIYRSENGTPVEVD